MLLLYRSLLNLYPAAYRHEYGEEMLTVLDEVCSDAQQRGLWASAVSCARESVGLLRGALLEHARKILFPQGLPMFLPGRFAMRSEFRFPKTTVTLMTIILIAVVMTIEKAKAISASLPHTGQTVGPIQPETFSTVTTLLTVLAGACVAGFIVWAVLFALQRSGVQRLSALKPPASTAPRSSSGIFS